MPKSVVSFFSFAAAFRGKCRRIQPESARGVNPRRTRRPGVAIARGWVILFLAMRIPSALRFALTVLWASACGSSSIAEVWRGEADIEFQGTSTLHDFSGTARTEPFFLLVETDGAAATLGGTASVAVARMDTRQAKRDANLRAMFEVDRHPFVAGVLESARIDTDRDSSVPLKLTIRGRTTRVPATIRNWRKENGAVRFDLDMTLSLREIGLSPPVLLGFIKVGDAVPVHARVALEQAPPN
jgi:polyisoprenoid-binding protein YceI